MEKISIHELAAVLTVKNGLKKKEAEQFVSMIFSVVKDHLISERQVKIKGLGTFKIVDIEPRESINVNTGERMLIEGHEKITFTPDTAMKELVNRPFSQFQTVILNEGVDFDAVNMDSSLAEPETENEWEEDNVLSVEEPNVTPDVEEETPIDEEPAPVVVEETATVNEYVVETADDKPEETVNEDAVETADDKPEETINEDAVETADDEPVKTTGVTLDDEPADEETTDVEDAEPTYDVDEEETGHSTPSIIWICLALAACALSFFAGYRFGVHHAETGEAADSVQVLAKDSVNTADTIKADTIVKETVVPVVAPTSQVKPAAPQTPQAKAQPEPTTAHPALATGGVTPEVDSEQYEQMDARIRTGAYRIVGTAKEVTVKEGETVQRIAQRHLGPGMECYVEAYNGIKGTTPLTPGQKLKIPQIQLKKKKKQQITNQE